MLNDLPAGQQVYLITGYTDLRRSIDGLASVVQEQFSLDPFSRVLLSFRGISIGLIFCLLYGIVSPLYRQLSSFIVK